MNIRVLGYVGFQKQRALAILDSIKNWRNVKMAIGDQLLRPEEGWSSAPVTGKYKVTIVGGVCHSRNPNPVIKGGI